MATKTAAKPKTRPGATPVVRYANREAWLLAATEALRPDFRRVGCALPERVHVSIGFTSKGKRSRAIGQCWDASVSADAVAHVFIVPTLADGETVLMVLVHELVHAAVGCAAGHGAEFGRPARALGLEGKLTATTAGAALTTRLREIIREIGSYPHGQLQGKDKTQGTRMLKVSCPGCGMVMRTTAKWLTTVGTPVCACGTRMEDPDGGYGIDLDDGEGEYCHAPDDDYCPHGVYIGGCGIDYMCGICENGYLAEAEADWERVPLRRVCDGCGRTSGHGASCPRREPIGDGHALAVGRYVTRVGEGVHVGRILAIGEDGALVRWLAYGHATMEPLVNLQPSERPR